MVGNQKLWQSVGPVNGILHRTYRASRFGPANSLCFSIGNGRCAVLSAPVDPTDDDFRAAESLGRVAALIVPSHGHRAGLDAWIARYPNATVYAPTAAIALAGRSKGRAFVPLTDLQTDGSIAVHEVPGAKTGGTFLSILTDERPVVYLDEILITMDQRPAGWLYRLLFGLKGIEPGIGVNRVYADWRTKDRKRVANLALSLLQDDPICVVAHGPVIDRSQDLDAARTALRSLD
ncbi:hypothetical protein [Qipengyuania spongiae]|uniref:MBL fold metallo-hydrolase n=1 Tax=Qipengyuania spongiae TaxID=2909673 RepID=A0ABY5SZL3_9SPHN|nr:hypothetical protein [Qipengyuania spongiae]UVI39952.1 hypothetical protein L1F33_03040 [Qipengyuania spongiae]